MYFSSKIAGFDVSSATPEFLFVSKNDNVGMVFIIIIEMVFSVFD